MSGMSLPQTLLLSLGVAVAIAHEEALGVEGLHGLDFIPSHFVDKFTDESLDNDEEGLIEWAKYLHELCHQVIPQVTVEVRDEHADNVMDLDSVEARKQQANDNLGES